MPVDGQLNFLSARHPVGIIRSWGLKTDQVRREPGDLSDTMVSREPGGLGR